MKLVISYDSTWRNSFLDGDNNSPIPKDGRNYIASSTSLKNKDNMIKRSITKNTVMGVLSLLIGDRRKLYQARAKQFGDYYFDDLEGVIHFEDKPTVLNDEVVFLRNIKRDNYDRNLFTGQLITSDPLLSADYSSELWGVLALDLEALIDFILNDTVVDARINTDPLLISERMKEIGALKGVDNEGLTKKAIKTLTKQFGDINYLTAKGPVSILALYCSALYVQLQRLSKRFDTSTAGHPRTGGLPGFAKRGFTQKDFINRFSSGGKKKIWGNPYMAKRRIKGQGEITESLGKASGKLEIFIDTDRARAKELKDIIEEAAVSVFPLGKKGLAYVSKITL